MGKLGGVRKRLEDFLLPEDREEIERRREDIRKKLRHLVLLPFNRSFKEQNEDVDQNSLSDDAKEYFFGRYVKLPWHYSLLPVVLQGAKLSEAEFLNMFPKQTETLHSFVKINPYYFAVDMVEYEARQYILSGHILAAAVNEKEVITSQEDNPQLVDKIKDGVFNLEGFEDTIFIRSDEASTGLREFPKKSITEKLSGDRKPDWREIVEVHPVLQLKDKNRRGRAYIRHNKKYIVEAITGYMEGEYGTHRKAVEAMVAKYPASTKGKDGHIYSDADDGGSGWLYERVHNIVETLEEKGFYPKTPEET
ncbi:hypothetical protein GCM10007094_41050 [Pseudovibrio japonicus]|uniref:Uncharacterized protein n=1 Tax=Pseudovibrio japonicus TaxID=366534 RepID=A0ABQ3EMX2_9HYPH|nr:hypothetical protein [Pseudovibrio japonicus]GHB47551.1 hypothetical protein GCM10007094_41050 [Pseudovibrio japonicus]